jgi:hypothetical protein
MFATASAYTGDELKGRNQHMIKELINRVLAKRTGYEFRRVGATWVPPGHFYSPIVDPDELRKDRDRVFNRERPVLGVDLNETSQIQLLEEFRTYRGLLPFTPKKSAANLYYYENDFYSYGDATILFCVLQHFRPGRIVEFGSGFSSCVILDTKRLFLPQLQCLFIDPHPDRLLKLAHGSLEGCTVLKKRAQALAFDEISLERNDVLFIDSTHVSKAGSDVNFHLFELLPRLPSGVLIHFHDVAYPFEYPEEWFFEQNRSWNECYVLRAFLTGNRDYEVVFFNDFMNRKHGRLIAEAFPLFPKNPGGALWLRKLR